MAERPAHPIPGGPGLLEVRLEGHPRPEPSGLWPPRHEVRLLRLMDGLRRRGGTGFMLRTRSATGELRSAETRVRLEGQRAHALLAALQAACDLDGHAPVQRGSGPPSRGDFELLAWSCHDGHRALVKLHSPHCTRGRNQVLAARLADGALRALVDFHQCALTPEDGIAFRRELELAEIPTLVLLLTDVILLAMTGPLPEPQLAAMLKLAHEGARSARRQEPKCLALMVACDEARQFVSRTGSAMASVLLNTLNGSGTAPSR